MKPTFTVTLDFERMPPVCRVQQDFGYRRAFRSGYTNGESWFFHAVARELRRQGYDVVKKLMYKDGHLVDGHEYYIRDRRGRWCVNYGYHQIRDAVEEFRRKGQVDLTVTGSPSDRPWIRPVFRDSRGTPASGYRDWTIEQDAYWEERPGD